MEPERIKTWKVQTTAEGVELTINGKIYKTSCGESIASVLGRAARGWNAPADLRECAGENGHD